MGRRPAIVLSRGIARAFAIDPVAFRRTKDSRKKHNHTPDHNCSDTGIDSQVFRSSAPTTVSSDDGSDDLRQPPSVHVQDNLSQNQLNRRKCDFSVNCCGVQHDTAAADTGGTSSRRGLLSSLCCCFTWCFNKQQKRPGMDDHVWPSNRIRTTKYTLSSFLYKNLREQFRRRTNQYFLLIVIISFVPKISPLTPWTSLLPLLFVLGVSAVREGIEDFRRYKADRDVNARTVQVLVPQRRSGFVLTPSESIRVGQIVRILRDEPFPADILILKSGLEEGICYVETSQLDGETSLKVFEPLVETQVLDLAALRSLTAIVQTDNPNRDLDDFSGTIASKDLVASQPLAPSVDFCDEGVSVVADSRSLSSSSLSSRATSLRSSAQKHVARNDDRTRSEDNDTTEAEEIRSDNIEAYIANCDILSLGGKQLLLRGAALRNTPWIIGVVVYTGIETKLTLNSSKPPSKFSQVDRRMNRFVLVLFLFKLVVCLAMASFSAIFQATSADDMSLLLGRDANLSWAEAFLFEFFAYFVLLSFLIPMSLMVTLEIVKVAQALYIEWDPQMQYDPFAEDEFVTNLESDSARSGSCESNHLNTPQVAVDRGLLGARAKTSNLNDELGLVKWVFCDKTGTLTDNKMDFAKCAVLDRHFEDPMSGELAAQLRGTKWSFKRFLSNVDAAFIDTNPSVAGDTGDVRDASSATFNGVQSSKKRLNARETVATAHFLLSLALCHSALATSRPQVSALIHHKKPKSILAKLRRNSRSINQEIVLESEDDADLAEPLHGHGSSIEVKQVRFEAQSPDEIALCTAAKANDFTFLGREGRLLTVDIMGSRRTFEVAINFEFSSERARQSVVVAFPNNRHIMYIKGADSVVLSRLQQNMTTNHIDKNLGAYARSGFRTLVFGMRILSSDEFAMLKEEYDEAHTAIEDRDEKVNRVADSWERNFSILGCSAIEDRLQAGVPETLTYLTAAGMKVWMITGDKQETAESIGYSSGLLEPSLPLCRVNARSSNRTKKLLVALVNRHGAGTGDVPVNHSPIGMIIDGKTLKYAIRDWPQLFLQLALISKSVICCRVSPLQKAHIVELIRTTTSDVTLAIGDGANDVSMIQAAHVGVGIVGKEGTQAARASDYALHRFRFLRRLVSVHGRYSLLRNAALIKSSLYKNMAFFFVQVWFGIYNGFSAQTLYDDWFITMFNITFTALPPMFLGLFEKDAMEDQIACVPQLFRSSANGSALSHWSVFWWVASSFWHSIVFFFALQFFFSTNDIILQSPDGGTAGLRLIGGISAAINVNVVWFKTALETQYWTAGTVLGYALSYLSLILMFIGISYAGELWVNGFGVLQLMMNAPVWWMLFLLITGLALLPDVLVKFIRRLYWPHDWEIVQEASTYSKRNAWIGLDHCRNTTEVRALDGPALMRHRALHSTDMPVRLP